MRRFDIFTLLSFILQSLPLTVAILYIFVFEGDFAKPLPLINCKISEIPRGTGMLLGGFLTLCLLLLGIFTDNLRHLVEWMCEWPFDEKCKENKNASTTSSTECAFYSRFHLEDIGDNHNNTSNQNPTLQNNFKTSIFDRKLERYNVRYFVAECMSSYALSGLLSLSLLALAYNGYLSGYITKTVQTNFFNEISFFIWFMFITIPYAIFMSFLLCWDKIEYINNIIKSLNKWEEKDKKFRILYNMRRKAYFTVFIFFYIILWLAYYQYPSIFNNWHALVLLSFAIIGLPYLWINPSKLEGDIDNCPLQFCNKDSKWLHLWFSIIFLFIGFLYLLKMFDMNSMFPAYPFLIIFLIIIASKFEKDIFSKGIKENCMWFWYLLIIVPILYFIIKLFFKVHLPIS